MFIQQCVFLFEDGGQYKENLTILKQKQNLNQFWIEHIFYIKIDEQEN